MSIGILPRHDSRDSVEDYRDGIEQLESVRRAIARLSPLILDGALAVLLFVLAVSASEAPRSGLLGATLIAIETLPLTLRRRFPFAVVVIVGSAALAHLLAGFHNGFFDTFAVVVAVYSAAANSPRRKSLAVLAILPIGLIVALLVDWHNRGQVSLVDIPYNAFLFGSSWVLGDSLRARRAYIEQVEERERLLASERVERARATVAEERARIARELHDIVAHSVSVMVLQANAGERIMPTRPEQAIEHFAVIQSTGRQALVELRRLLGVLRGSSEEGELRPQPQLADIATLAGQARRSGLATSLEIESGLDGLPEAVQVSAYRVVQEALTNAMRHGDAASAAIMLRRIDSDLEIEVRDDGRRLASSEPIRAGHGLIGMRERVQLFGGTLEAGPLPGKGFHVNARFPLNGRRP